MSEMEEKLGAILNNPQLMQQVMSMAQSLSHTQEPQSSPPKEPNINPLPQIDPGMLQKLSGFAGQNSIDKDQKALLNALCPYLPQGRVEKLEKAMRAARMAKFASTFLGNGGLSMLTGR